MSIPLVEQIAEKVATRMALVTVAGGYNFDIAQVVRPNRNVDNFDKKHLTGALMYGEKVRNVANDDEKNVYGSPAGTACWQQRFVIHLLVIPPVDTEPIDRVVEQFAADVTRAIGTPEIASDDWTQWGGLAVDSWWDDPEQLVSEDGSLDGMELNLIVKYRTAENNPYTQA